MARLRVAEFPGITIKSRTPLLYCRSSTVTNEADSPYIEQFSHICYIAVE